MTALAYIVALAVLAYALFFAYDWRIVGRRGGLGTAALFGVGCALVAAATLIMLATQLPAGPRDAIALVSLAAALVFAALMAKALFFSLPKDTYTAPEQPQRVYAEGMYALCRHPGVLWYCLAFAALALALRTPVALVACCVLCLGNLAYMMLQDAWSFPRTFVDYAEYKQRVPLFFPTRASIRAALAPGGAVCARKSDGGAHGSF